MILGVPELETTLNGSLEGAMNGGLEWPHHEWMTSL